MTETSLVVLVKLTQGQEIICRAEEEGAVVTLKKPAVVVALNNQMGLDSWPMFARESEEVKIDRANVLCITGVVKELEDAYLRWTGESTVIAPKNGLLLPQ